MSKTEGYTHPDHVVSCKAEVKKDPGEALRYACSRIYWKKLGVICKSRAVIEGYILGYKWWCHDCNPSQ